MKRFVFNFDDAACPSTFDNLPRSIEFAKTRAKRFLEYAKLAEDLLARVQSER